MSQDEALKEIYELAYPVDEDGKLKSVSGADFLMDVCDILESAGFEARGE